MKRTQISLEEWQYRSLVQEARREGKSMSMLVREAVEAYIVRSPADARSRLRAICAVAEDDPGVAQQHDDYLYGID